MFATQFHISHLLTLGQCLFSIVSYTRRRPSCRGLLRDYDPLCGPSVEEYGHIILTLPMNIGASCCLQQAWDQDGSGKWGWMGEGARSLYTGIAQQRSAAVKPSSCGPPCVVISVYRFLIIARTLAVARKPPPTAWVLPAPDWPGLQINISSLKHNHNDTYGYKSYDILLSVWAFWILCLECLKQCVISNSSWRW